ncbi:MAG: hypothetical protein AAFN78_15555, partial [Pseudomonadota bacterium]
AAPSDDTSVALLDKTFLPVVARLNYSSRPLDEQQLAIGELVGIAESYMGIWGSELLMPDADVIEWLRGQNPEFEVLVYLNSSHTVSNEVDTAQAESNRIDLINLYHEAYLADPVSATDTQLRLRAADDERGFGLVASTTPGEFSTSANDYVTYVRVGDELMRIEAVSANGETVTVSRGFQGTPAVPHASDAIVLAPVYTGPGFNQQTTGSIPGNAQGVLPAYSLQVGTPAGGLFFARKVADLLATGADGAWLDICSPKFFNQLTAVGKHVTPWNLESGHEFSYDERRLHQDRKLNSIQQFVLSSTGQWPVLLANNNANGKYFEEGGRGMDFVLPTPAKPLPVEGVVLEAAFSEAPLGDYFNEARWLRNLSTITHGGQNGLPVWPWIKSAYSDYRVDSPETEDFEYFDYASALLGWELGSGAAISLPLFAEAQPTRRLNLSQWLFFDLGEPVDRVPFDAIEALRVEGTRSYLRRWSKGVVVVNPTDEDDASVALPGQYLVPGTRQKVASIALPAYSASILLLELPETEAQ